MILRSFIGSIIFEIIGAAIRWFFLLITGKKKSYFDVYNGPKKMKLQDSMGYGMSNILLGMGFVIFVIIIIKLLGI